MSTSGRTAAWLTRAPALSKEFSFSEIHVDQRAHGGVANQSTSAFERILVPLKSEWPFDLSTLGVMSLATRWPHEGGA
jgi:hypothetical protein